MTLNFLYLFYMGIIKMVLKPYCTHKLKLTYKNTDSAPTCCLCWNGVIHLPASEGGIWSAYTQDLCSKYPRNDSSSVCAFWPLQLNAPSVNYSLVTLERLQSELTNHQMAVQICLHFKWLGHVMHLKSASDCWCKDQILLLEVKFCSGVVLFF